MGSGLAKVNIVAIKDASIGQNGHVKIGGGAVTTEEDTEVTNNTSVSIGRGLVGVSSV